MWNYPLVTRDNQDVFGSTEVAEMNSIPEGY